MAFIMALKAQGMTAAQITAAVNEYLQDHPDALDQAAVEAILDGRLDVIDDELDTLKSASVHWEDITATYTRGAYINLQNKKAGDTTDFPVVDNQQSYGYVKRAVVKRDAFRITGTGANAARPWCFTNNAGKILAIGPTASPWAVEDLIITAPDDGWLVCNARWTTTPPRSLKQFINAGALLDIAAQNAGDEIDEAISQVEAKAVIYQGSLAEGTDLNTLSENGRYSFGGGVRDTLINKPEGLTSGTGVLFVFKGAGSGSTLSTQLLISDTASTRIIYERVINNTTSTAVYDWQQIIYPIANTTGTSTTKLMTQKAITDAIEAASHQSSSVWAGKRIVAFGDSRTWYDGHQYKNTEADPCNVKDEWNGLTCIGYLTHLRNILGCTVDNQGWSGYTSVMLVDKIVPHTDAETGETVPGFDFTGYDAVFLAGGVNDFIRPALVPNGAGAIAPIGGPFDAQTSYGAWQTIIEYILNNFKGVPIYMDIPPIAWKGTDIFPYATAKIKGDVAALYNIPCIDLYTEGNINILNRDYWYVDNLEHVPQYRLHFNDYGNALMGRKIAGFLATH